MSYCTVTEIGDAARGRTNVAVSGSLRIVRSAEQHINAYLGYNGLYDPESSWDVRGYDAGLLFASDGSQKLSLNYPVIDLSRVRVYSAYGALLEDFDDLDTTDHYSAFWAVPDQRAFLQAGSLGRDRHTRQR